MKTWFSWLVLACLVWAIPPALRAQDTQSQGGGAANVAPPQGQTQMSAAAPAPQANAAAPAPQANAVAPAPGVTPTPVGTPEGGKRVEATVEQLEQLINAPPEARLGREIDEPAKPFSLFKDQKRIDQLLGENPRYVYIPMGTDPMILPWVRNRVMAAELVQEALELKSSGKYQEALSKVDLVLDRFGDTDSVEKARQLKMQLEAIVHNESGGEGPKVTPGPTPRTLPVWIPENTRGIVFDVHDPKNSSVLIGEYILHAGESIPSYPGIKVVEIQRSMVTLNYQGEVFQLPVEGTGP